VPRYRIRFLLQEFDLPGAVVDIGRGPECQVTVEDPLVSRRHARICVAEDGSAQVEDLGSRNGVRINGKLIEGPSPLRHGDRLRLGTQDLVFIEADAPQRAARTTGFLALCAACAKPYPEQAPECPHCGAASREDDTLSGVALEPRQTFTFQLLGQVIERALASGRPAEADRVMRRAAQELDERLERGDRIGAGHLDTMAGYALELAEQAGSEEWLRWMFDLHRRQGVLPSPSVVDRLDRMKGGLGGTAVADFVHWVHDQATRGPSGDPAVLRRLDEMARHLKR
jgi:hypothetical protein